MPLQIHDRTIPLSPDRLDAVRRVRQPFAAKNLGVHADDQYLLVIGSVEDADPPTFRQVTGGPPEKIVLQFRWAWMLEAEHPVALGVDPGHDVLDGAVFSRRIHRLKDQQYGIAIGRVEK